MSRAQKFNASLPLRVLLVADDVRLRARLRGFLQQSYDGVQVEERRDLRDNQTVWDIRSERYQLLLVQCEAGDRDELEFLASLNHTGYARTAVLVVAHEAHIPAIRAVNLGALDFVARDGLDPAGLRDKASRALDRRGPGPQTKAPEARNLLLPELVIKGYQPVRTLSLSAETCVLQVRRAADDAPLVLKCLLQQIDGERVIKRFLQECRIAGTQTHRHIVEVREQGLAGAVAYYVMEYLAGGSLKARMRRSEIPPKLALRILRQLAEALAHLHGNDILHLDVKAGNVLFRDRRTAVLADFGAARHLLLERSYTLKDHALGTPHYMSPEQATGRPLDARADLYGLGILLYEMLTGRCPYVGDTVGEVLRQHLQSPVPELPPPHAGLQPLLARLLAKRPEQRFTCAAELLDALSAARAADTRTRNT